jgi:hypothetical protein
MEDGPHLTTPERAGPTALPRAGEIRFLNLTGRTYSSDLFRTAEPVSYRWIKIQRRYAVVYLGQGKGLKGVAGEQLDGEVRRRGSRTRRR